MNVNTKQKGFTIIEVVLVLAIAALIFLMVFIALPALQRGQRDTARKQDANTVASAINTWRGNHRGQLPTVDDIGEEKTLTVDYIKTLGQYSPDKITSDVTGSGIPATMEDMVIRLKYVCADSGDGKPGVASSRGASVLVKLEASSAVVCTDA